jgi:hypothetical protein
MICNHAHECGSRECKHRKPHPLNGFCTPGRCRWAGDTVCQPENHIEMLEDLLKRHFPNETIPEIRDQILDIFQGGNE